MRPLSRAFSLIEMLVVISLITLLMAMLMPSLARAKFETKVTRCLSNFHQWGNATLSYAGDFSDALPRQDIPQTTGVNTWDVSNEFPVQMGKYGLTEPEMWDCPTRGELAHLDNFEQVKDRFKSYYGHFSIIEHNWWVPRQFGCAFFPSRDFDPQAVTDRWPISVSDSRGGVHPILTCRVGLQKSQPPEPRLGFDGHQFNDGVESTTLLFTDAHAERQHVDQMEIRYSGNWFNIY